MQLHQEDGEVITRSVEGLDAEAVSSLMLALKEFPDLPVSMVFLVVGAQWAYEREGATIEALGDGFAGLLEGLQHRSGAPLN